MKTHRLFVSLLAFLAAPAYAQVEIEQPWCRAMPAGTKLGACYLVVRNKSASPDRLVGASSPAAARVETHVTRKEGEVMTMRPVQGYDIPAGGSLELKPAGAHLMFVDVRQPFKEGDKVPVTLRFQKAGEVKAEFAVQKATPMAHGHMQMH
ncbi:MAG: copper chaperone PCu(A)C [Clostridia bacterium]